MKPLEIGRGAWAPLVVLAASFPLAATPFAEDAYPALHVLGGVTLAYFFRRAVRLVHRGWPPVLSSLVAFSLACTGALAWEIGEFVVDFVAGTALQEGLFDTMTDLILAAAGAAAWLALRRCAAEVHDLTVQKATMAAGCDGPTVPDRPTDPAGRRHPRRSAKYRTAP